MTTNNSLDCLLFGGDAGVVGASARCNSEMSVLGQANERQPGPGVQVGSFVHNTKGVSPHRKTMRCGELFLHFARQECLYRCMPYSTLRSSLKMMGVHHLSQTSNKICHSVCDTHPFKSLIEWSVQKNGLCQIDIAIFGADEGT